jgi:hypothetical protein
VTWAAGNQAVDMDGPIVEMPMVVLTAARGQPGAVPLQVRPASDFSISLSSAALAASCTCLTCNEEAPRMCDRWGCPTSSLKLHQLCCAVQHVHVVDVMF